MPPHNQAPLPDPRILSSQKHVAALLGKPEVWFRKNRLKLEESGFPRFDDLLEGWDIDAINLWVDQRSCIKRPGVEDASGPALVPTKEAGTSPVKPKVYTVKTAAARLGFSTDTVYSLINSCELSCTRRPNCAIRIKEEHLLAYEGKFEQKALSIQTRKDKDTVKTNAIKRAASAARAKAKARMPYTKPSQPQN